METLRLLNQRSFDLIITDYAMPGMTGEELTQQIRANRPTLPVPMVSGYASLPEGTGTSVPKLGKPFKERELAQAIAEVIALKRAAQERRATGRFWWKHSPQSEVLVI